MKVNIFGFSGSLSDEEAASACEVVMILQISLTEGDFLARIRRQEEDEQSQCRDKDTWDEQV